MLYSIEKKLVVAVSTSALFDLRDEDSVFTSQGVVAYRNLQIEKRHTTLPKGMAFPFIRRFLNINKVYFDKKPVEVVILSRNSPETGVRAINSVREYGLDITRAVFTSGQPPFRYMPAYNASLFLTTNYDDVIGALRAHSPAGRVLETVVTDDESDAELRVAFDFDGVLADDEAERVYKETRHLEAFHQHEVDHADIPLNPGPLADFFQKLSFFQEMENKKQQTDPTYKKILKTAIVTARCAPSDLRAIKTLESWKVTVDDLFLLGGIEKARILKILKPHLYIDDQPSHLNDQLQNIPLVHIPFGIANDAKGEDPK